MASTLAPGGTPTARLNLDLSALAAAPQLARQYGQATAKEISNAFKLVQAEQRLALEQARQTTVTLRTQQAQISATARAESSVRIAAAKAEQAERTQAARAAAAAQIETERRTTAEFRAQLRARESAARASQMSMRGVATFAGAAFGGPIGGLAGAVAGGSPLLALGLAVNEGARFALRADEQATAYNRQRVAAESLAGSQARLNELLETYRRVTRGAIDESTALADVTALMSQGFADSTDELAVFLKGVRGAAVAMGEPQEFIITRLQLELLNQTGLRLNEIGLSMAAVRQRAAALQQANSGLTKEAAYQAAVLEELQAKYGAVADSPSANPTNIERLSRSWRDLTLAVGQYDQKFSLLQVGAGQFVKAFDLITAGVNRLNEALTRAGQLLGLIERQAERSATIGSRTGLGAAQREGIPTLQRTFTDEQTALIVDRRRTLNEIDRQSNRAIIESASQYARQRAETISNYEKQVVRESEDFARQRVRAQAQYERQIGEALRDSAERRAKLQRDFEESIAEARNDSNRRVAEMERDYQRERERAAITHRENLFDAAARLDAVAVMQEQRRFAREQREREEDHRDAIGRERAQLAAQIDDRRKALDRQIEEQRRNDEQRLAELKAAFDLQRQQEDEDRRIRLDRQAQDHAAQLAEMDRAQVERIGQIKRQAQEERDQYETEFRAAMVEQGIRIKAWQEEQNLITQTAITEWDKLMDAIINRTVELRDGLKTGGADSPTLSRAAGGPIPHTGPILAHAGEYVLNASTTRALSGMMGGFDQANLLATVRGSGRNIIWNGDVSVTIAGSANMGAGEMYIVARQAFHDALEEVARI